MYRIYCDNNLIYNSNFENTKISKGQIDLEVNKSGTFTFGLYPEHNYYNQIQKLSSMITVYRDNELIFRGRVIKSSEGFYGEKVFTCEGELSFLLDSLLRSYNITGTPAQVFTQFINKHNQEVREDKRFEIGRITVTDPNNYINRSNSAYESTLSNLQSRLLETLGGYIVIDSNNGTRRINYLSELEGECSQRIQFGENLLDFTRERNADEIITVLVPRGAVIEGDRDKRVDIKSVNDGKDYIINQQAVDLYGYIYGTQTWDDVTSPSNLKTKAVAYLNSMTSQTTTIELSAIDLSNLDKNIDSFRIGDHIEVISKPHGLQATYILTKQSIDLLRPENDKVSLGYVSKTFTDTTLGNSIAANAVVQVNQRVDEIDANYVDTGTLDDEINGVIEIINTPSEWTALTVEATFSSLTGLKAKQTTNCIYLKGNLTVDSDIYTSALITTLPEGIRPEFDMWFPETSSVGNLHRILVSPTGAVWIYGRLTPSTTITVMLSYSLGV